MCVGFLIRQSAETASTKEAVTVGVNALLMSGKETEITNAPLNVCEVKKRNTSNYLTEFS